MTWHAYLTEPRREFAVIEEMIALGADAFTPIEIRLIRVRALKKVRRQRVPLLPRYVFACFFGPTPWHKLADIKGLSVVIKVAGEPARVSARDIAIARHMTAGVTASTYRRSLGIGDDVRVVGLPLAGALARILKVVDGKATVAISLMGAERSATVPVERLERV